MSQTEYVTQRAWDGLARRLERERLRACGTSLSATSIAARANSYIVETSSDRPMLVRTGWRAAMIAAAQANDFARAANAAQGGKTE